MNRRQFLQMITALGLTGGLAAARGDDPAPLLIRINVPGPHLLPFIPIELIPQLGLDRALGAQLVIRHMPSGVPALERVVAGDAQFAAVGFPVLARFAGKGKPVVALASLSSGMPPYVLLVRKDLAGRITRMEDLKGRSIGAPLGSETAKSYPRTLLELWLSAHDIGADQVRWVPTSIDFSGMYGALASGAVDAVFCEEPLSSALLRAGHGQLLASLNDAEQCQNIPARGHLRAVIASTPKTVAAEPQRTRLLIQMLLRALDWMRDKSPRQIIQQLPIPDTSWADDLSAALTRLPSIYSANAAFTEGEIEASRNFLQATGTSLPEGMDLRQLIDGRWTGIQP
ncbi:MAG: ABC transporter substrate-binding protein [Gammaproteobacteria bacterium SHHR-1]